ncbi:TPA: phage holin [Bacillus paranthracis]|nr:phage holin [Bacillus paranthracis]HDR7304505.1 phage holin [Bacillus paranthracis]
MTLKEIISDKALTTKYVVLGFAVINSVCNLLGYQTISEADINNVANGVSSIVSILMLLNIRSHEIKSIKAKQSEDNPPEFKQEREDA